MKITKTHLAQIIQEEVAKSIEEGMMDKIGTKFRSMTGKSTPQDKYKHYIAKANKMILDLATFMFRKMDLDGVPDTTEELLKNPHGHDGRLSAIKTALKRSKLTRNDTIKKSIESLDNLIHDKNRDVALQYFAGGDDLEKFRGHPFMAAVRWIDSYDVDDVASALSRTWSNKRSGDDDRKAAIGQRNIDSERETTHRDREQLNQRVAAKKYQKQVAAERERELSRQGNRDNLSADTTMRAFGESLDRTKITKSKLAQIVQEEVASIVEEGMMDTIRSKLSPKRPAKAPYQKSENDKEKMHQMGVEDANDAMHITGAFRESPSSPDDEDYMAGWNDTIQGANSAMQEGKNKIKITKSALAEIVQEELTAMKAEGYGAYKRNDKKGLSPQYRDTDAASTDDTEDRFHKSEHSPYSDKKPKRGKKDLGEAEGRYEFELDPKVQQSVLQALANSGTGALDFPLPLTPEQEKYYSHLDDGDRQSMLRDVVEELVEGGEAFKDADGLYYAVQGLDEGGYDDEYDYGADERAEEEYFSQALWDAVDGALEDLNGTPAPKHEIITRAPKGIDELDWDEMGEKYLSSLIDDGTVELRQGSPGDDWNGEEELYVLALR